MRAVVASVLLVFATAMALAQPCSHSATALCLSAGRFEVTVAWTDFQGNNGIGQAIPLTADTGYFWFFTNTNVELVIKVLDARAINGHFWVFYGALSNVQYEITVRDSQTGDVQVYDNPSGQFASTGDTLAFPPSATATKLSTESRVATPVGRPVDESLVAPAVWDSAAACTPSATALCLSGGRFRVEAVWKDFQGNTGVGQAVGLTSDTGYFWFFSNTNVEAVIKVLDARPINNYFWVFYGALSNVEYTLTVTDTVTGIVRIYSNPSQLFASVGDTLAFGPPTAFQLIDGGVVKGEIDSETALLYKVYAFFGNSRLPQAYAGDPPGNPEHGILSEVANRWSGLSSQTQQALRPFLTVPTDPGSWFAQIPAFRTPVLERSGSLQGDWTRIPTDHCVVWYRAADAGAETAANNLAAEAETVWNAETGLMRKPVGDGLLPVPNGGDGRYDFYVLPSFANPRDTGADGVLTPYPDQDATAPRAAYTLIRASSAATVVGARTVLAHEFFHAIAAAFTNGLNGWLNEATATWMEDFVYRNEIQNVEQLWAGRYLIDGYKLSYDNPNPSDGGYPNYLFLFYLDHQSSPEVNHQIWVNVETMSSLQAIAAAIPGGFAERWPEFALDCWNHPDVDNFSKWDNLGSALVEGNAEPYLGLSSNTGTSDLPSFSVDHLAMRYAYVDVADDSIKRLEIRNRNVSSGSDNARTKAWLKLADGTTRIEDWSGKEDVVFCRDKASEHVTKILILYTNSGQDAPVVWNEGKVNYDSAGCGYQGTVHTTRHYENSGYKIDEVIDATEVTFAQSSGLASNYYPARYTISYKATESTKDFAGVWCTETIGPVTKTFTCSVCDGNDLMIPITGTYAGYYAALTSFGIDSAPVTNACPQGKKPGTPVAQVWWNIPLGQYRVNPDGSLSGTYTDGVYTFTWSFKPDVGDE